MSGEESSTSGLGSRELGPVERTFAALIGLVGVGTGGTGIFLSTNQAGTTAILLIGAAFLLMAVQGTAIVKIGKDSAELARRQAKELTSKAVAEFEADRPDAGRAYANAAEIVSSQPTASAELEIVTSYVWQERVIEALQRVLRVYYTSTIRLERASTRGKEEANAIIIDEANLEKIIAVRIFSEGFGQSLPSAVIERLHAQAKRGAIRSLLITRESPSRATMDSVERTDPGVPAIRLIRWNGEDDQTSLLNAIGQLFEAA